MPCFSSYTSEQDVKTTEETSRPQRSYYKHKIFIIFFLIEIGFIPDPELEHVSPHLDAGLLLNELQELGALGHGGVQDGALLFQALPEKTELKIFVWI